MSNLSTNTVDLKPCPFCAGAAEMSDAGDGDQIECEKCCFSIFQRPIHEGRHTSKARLIERWNRRAPEPSVWQPIETAPRGPVLVARIDNGHLFWAEAAHRGDGVLRKMWYSPGGSSVPQPTHWAALPETKSAEQELPKGAVPVVNPQGTGETGIDRPAAPSPRETPCPVNPSRIHQGYYFCKLCGKDLTPDIPWADGPGRGL